MKSDIKNNNTKLIRIANEDFQSLEYLRLAFIKKTDKIINKKDFISAITKWLSSNFDEWTRPQVGQKNIFNNND